MVWKCLRLDGKVEDSEHADFAIEEAKNLELEENFAVEFDLLEFEMGKQWPQVSFGHNCRDVVDDHLHMNDPQSFVGKEHKVDKCEEPTNQCLDDDQDGYRNQTESLHKFLSLEQVKQTENFDL